MEEKKPSKWTSRKFLESLAAKIVSILVIVGWVPAENVDSLTRILIGVVALVVTVLGYQITEGRIDKENAKVRVLDKQIELEKLKGENNGS